jgi:hypothetical protein
MPSENEMSSCAEARRVWTDEFSFLDFLCLPFHSPSIDSVQSSTAPSAPKSFVKFVVNETSLRSRSTICFSLNHPFYETKNKKLKSTMKKAQHNAKVSMNGARRRRNLQKNKKNRADRESESKEKEFFRVLRYLPVTFCNFCGTSSRLLCPSLTSTSCHPGSSIPAKYHCTM